MAYPVDYDGDGYYDSLALGANMDGLVDTLETPYGTEVYDDFAYSDSMPGAFHPGTTNLGGGFGFGDGGGYEDPHLDFDRGGGGGGYGEDLLWENMSYLTDQELPLYEAWGESGFWTDEHYALADLMHYQRQLELDSALNEQERLHRWEERLRWESLEDEAERSWRYRSMDPHALANLGLAGGFWAHQLGGRSLDLGYLRNLQLTRGLFTHPAYRSRFARFSSAALLHHGPPQFISTSTSRAGAVPLPPPISLVASSGSLSLREQELRTRLRIAETRATLTSLPLALRAAALEDARRIKGELRAEAREAERIEWAVEESREREWEWRRGGGGGGGGW